MFPEYDKTKYKSVKWNEVKEGYFVWIKGICQGEFRAYGPHTVIDPVRKCLENEYGEKFLDFSEDLLIKVED
jgi:hypothetical protein